MIPASRRSRFLGLISIVLLQSACLPEERSTAPSDSPQESVRKSVGRLKVGESLDWNAAFQRTDGWTGGDGDYSVDLGDSRTLWLFSDSWIGRVRNGKHAPGSRLVNNAIGVHPTPPRGGAPDPGAMRFFHGPNDAKGRPTAWITPTSVTPDAPKTWYWLADGLVAPGPTGKDRLLIFLWHIGRRTKQPSAWNFKSVGGGLAVIDNPHEPVKKWNVVQFKNPHAITADQANDNANRAETSWGSEVLLVPSGKEKRSDTLYIYGVREADKFNKQLLLARAPAQRVELFGTWAFRTKTGWSHDLSQAVSLADHIANEFSIDPVEIGNRTVWIMVHSEPPLGPHILVRTAKRPEGPWSDPIPVYRVRGIEKNKSYFTYAAKGHAHLSPPGQLLISYIINALDFKAMVDDADIYRPRFVRLALDQLPLP